MKIGIYGGSFNPPHKMHKSIVMQLLKKEYLDKIIVVPVADSYSKPNLLTGEDRIKMTKDIFRNCSSVEVSDYEVMNKESFTIDTLKHYKRVYPKDEFYFVLGADLFYEFNKWKNYEEILSNYKLLVIARENNDFSQILNKYEKYKNKIILANVKPQNISSTKIREEILKHGFTDNLKTLLYASTIKYLKNIDLNKYWKSKRSMK